MEELKYKVISTGSKGNCVIIEDMMFDLGVTYQKIKNELYNIKYLFITHRHSDHLNRKTFNKVKKMFPRIQVIANWEVSGIIPVDIVVGDSTSLCFEDRKVESFACLHDVITHGYVVDYKDLSFIYVTDTASMENAPIKKYDYFFIESNHDENIIKQIQDTAVKDYGYNAWENAQRHLSIQQAKLFYFMNRKNKESELIELHMSSRFYR